MPETPDDVLSVTQLTLRLKQAIEGSFRDVTVVGEISDFTRSAAGHLYFALKDAESQIRAAIWQSHARRIPFALREGLQVVCRGGVSLYPPRGSYQLIVRQLEPVGIGAQQLALQERFARLKREGLFDPAAKRPLPAIARRIGMVTSPAGAALHDMLQVIRRRWSDVEIFLLPTRVQGEAAPPQIVAALASAGRLQPPLDVVIVARGGGSAEDISCFNDERVVRAVRACPVPVVSAVGHEVDVTLCDLAADVRALTPSEAGERVVPDRRAIQQRLLELSQRLERATSRRIDRFRLTLAAFERLSFFRRPKEWIAARREACDRSVARLLQAVRLRLQSSDQAVGSLAARLEAVNPLAVLRRGYSVTWGVSGKPLGDARQVQIGESISTRLARGRLISRVESVQIADGEAVEDQARQDP